MTDIVAAGNTEVPAYLVLIEKGYDVLRDGSRSWAASKGGAVFRGEGPLEILGIVCMYEIRGDDWSASDEEIDGFLKRFSQG